jgi:hypothetical protein
MSVGVTWTAELWLEPYSERVGGYSYRAVLRDPFIPYPFRDTFFHPRVCSRGSVYEIGAFEGEPILRFVPPNRLVSLPIGGLPPNLAMGEGPNNDVVANLRRALRTGKAHDEGRTKRDGRTLAHIRLTWGDAYVDPDTFYPVEIDLGDHRFPDSEIHFKAYEYLPRTAANLALTDIRAQHPHAQGFVTAGSSSDIREHSVSGWSSPEPRGTGRAARASG